MSGKGLSGGPDRRMRARSRSVPYIPTSSLHEEAQEAMESSGHSGHTGMSMRMEEVGMDEDERFEEPIAPSKTASSTSTRLGTDSISEASSKGPPVVLVDDDEANTARLRPAHARCPPHLHVRVSAAGVMQSGRLKGALRWQHSPRLHGRTC